MLLSYIFKFTSESLKYLIKSWTLAFEYDQLILIIIAINKSRSYTSYCFTYTSWYATNSICMSMYTYVYISKFECVKVDTRVRYSESPTVWNTKDKEGIWIWDEGPLKLIVKLPSLWLAKPQSGLRLIWYKFDLILRGR